MDQAAARAPAAHEPQRTLAELVNVRKRFGGVLALDGVTFSVAAGEVHALVGENGAGKSTLMKVLAGLHQPDEGIVLLDEEPVSLRSAHDAKARGIALIPQELELFDELSVTENLFVGRARPRTRWGTFDQAAMRRTARRLFEALGVDLDVRAAVGRLSPATRQLVEIARALARDARVLIMDEPTAALSERESRRLFRVIRDLTARGVGVVYISHRLGEVFALADRITVLRDGRSLHTAPAADYTEEQLVRLMVGRPLSQLFRRTHHDPAEVLLEVEGLTRRGAYRDVSFHLRRGEILGLAGLIGAGRTELAHALCGIEPPDAGEIRLDGRPIAPRTPGEALRLGIAHVPEERRAEGLVLAMSIADNLTFGSLRRLSRLGLLQRRPQYALASGLADRLTVRGAPLSAPVRRLSGGNQQKVVIGKALAEEPSVIVLDEPTRGVDIGAKSEIYRLVDELARRGKAVLLISSELAEVISMSDRVLVMREGGLVAELGRGEATQEAIGAAATGAVRAGELA